MLLLLFQMFVGNMLQSILSGPVITNSMAMATPLATSFLQQHVNSVLAAQSMSSRFFYNNFFCHNHIFI